MLHDSILILAALAESVLVLFAFIGFRTYLQIRASVKSLMVQLKPNERKELEQERLWDEIDEMTGD